MQIFVVESTTITSLLSFKRRGSIGKHFLSNYLQMIKKKNIKYETDRIFGLIYSLYDINSRNIESDIFLYTNNQNIFRYT